MRNFILQDVDYIILDPIVETGWDAVLEEAKAAGIPVIIMDRKVETEDDSLYTCWVGSNFEEQGRRAGEWLADYLEEQDRSEETIRMVTLQGNLGSTAQIGRTSELGNAGTPGRRFYPDPWAGGYDGFPEDVSRYRRGHQ